MKIVSNTYRFEKVVSGTIELELDENNPTYLKGRAGGSSYVAAIIPQYYAELKSVGKRIVETGKQVLSGFVLISSTREKEGRIMLSAGSINDWRYLAGEIKAVPHGEDILNWFTDDGEKYTHVVCSESDFMDQIKEWRIV